MTVPATRVRGLINALTSLLADAERRGDTGVLADSIEYALRRFDIPLPSLSTEEQ